MLNNISKIWIINLVLVAAVLFVYGGLSWLDSKDPEAATTKAPKTANAELSFTQKLSNFFSFGGQNGKIKQGAEEVEYGYTEDGLRLPVASDDYKSESNNDALDALTPNAKENQARLNEVIHEIAQANHELSELVVIQNQQPDNHEINAIIEEAENNLYELQDERESLISQIQNKHSGQDGF